MFYFILGFPSAGADQQKLWNGVARALVTQPGFLLPLPFLYIDVLFSPRQLTMPAPDILASFVSTSTSPPGGFISSDFKTRQETKEIMSKRKEERARRREMDDKILASSGSAPRIKVQESSSIGGRSYTPSVPGTPLPAEEDDVDLSSKSQVEADQILHEVRTPHPSASTDSNRSSIAQVPKESTPPTTSTRKPTQKFTIAEIPPYRGSLPSSPTINPVLSPSTLPPSAAIPFSSPANSVSPAPSSIKAPPGLLARLTLNLHKPSPSTPTNATPSTILPSTPHSLPASSSNIANFPAADSSTAPASPRPAALRYPPVPSPPHSDPFSSHPAVRLKDDPKTQKNEKNTGYQEEEERESARERDAEMEGLVEKVEKERGQEQDNEGDKPKEVSNSKMQEKGVKIPTKITIFHKDEEIVYEGTELSTIA